MADKNKIEEIIKIMMRIIIQDSENKEKKYVYYAVIKTLNYITKIQNN